MPSASAIVMVLLAQLPAPNFQYPVDGGVRSRYLPLSLRDQPEVRETVWELASGDGGMWSCIAPGSCAQLVGARPLFELFPPSLPDGLRCARASFRYDAGTSPTTQRCFVEDGLAPADPIILDAGVLRPGLAFIDYVPRPDVGPSGFARVCGGALELDLPGTLFTDCSPPNVWANPVSTDAGRVLVPLGPGRWTPSLVAYDRADNFSGFPRAGLVTMSANRPAPPPPEWLPDGGTAGPNPWTNDPSAGALGFPGLDGGEFVVASIRTADGGFFGVYVPGAPPNFFPKLSSPQRWWRYAVVFADGGLTEWSDELALRLDVESPPPIVSCAATVSGSRVELVFDGGIDALAPAGFVLQAQRDGGVRSESRSMLPVSATLPDGEWFLSLSAFDEAGNQTGPTPCGSVLVDTNPPACTTSVRFLDACKVEVSAHCTDLLSAIGDVQTYRDDGATLEGLGALDGGQFSDMPPNGTWRYGSRATDARGNQGVVTFSDSVSVACDAGGRPDTDAGHTVDAGVAPDAGLSPEDAGERVDAGQAPHTERDAGATEQPAHPLSVGCSCDTSFDVTVAFGVLALRLRRRPTARKAG